MEAWIFHFLNVEMHIEPVRKIEEPRWAWHIGLDAESTAILNTLWAARSGCRRMRRILALFRMDFAEPREMRRDIAGGRSTWRSRDDEKRHREDEAAKLLLNLPLNEA